MSTPGVSWSLSATECDSLGMLREGCGSDWQSEERRALLNEMVSVVATLHTHTHTVPQMSRLGAQHTHVDV